MAKPIVAVNGRFLTMAGNTGTQRYAYEILRRLGTYLESELRVIVPPDGVCVPDDADLGAIANVSTWHGAVGHGWEQFSLPRLVRRAGAQTLWSPCGWGLS